MFAIQLLCKFGLVIILLLGMFGLEGVIAIALWTGLALTSPFSHILIKHGRPLVNTLLSEYARIEHIVKKTLKGVIPTSRIIT